MNESSGGLRHLRKTSVCDVHTIMRIAEVELSSCGENAHPRLAYRVKCSKPRGLGDVYTLRV